MHKWSEQNATGEGEKRANTPAALYICTCIMTHRRWRWIRRMIDYVAPVCTTLHTLWPISSKNRLCPFHRVWLTEEVKTVITCAVVQFSRADSCPIIQRPLSERAAFHSGQSQLWSIEAKINQKRIFNFTFALLIRESSQLWATTWGRTEESIPCMLESMENSLHHHYLCSILSLWN